MTASSSSSISTSSSTSSSFYLSPTETLLVLQYFFFRLRLSVRKCLSDRYFKANIVYLVYSCLLLHIDMNIGRESASDTMYTLLGYIHILNGKWSGKYWIQILWMYWIMFHYWSISSWIKIHEMLLITSHSI